MLEQDDSLRYASLAGFWRRDLRNGTWSRANSAERVMFRCTLWLARARDKIANTKLMVQVLKIAVKLLTSFRSRKRAAVDYTVIVESWLG
jgi:hypothetical protein